MNFSYKFFQTTLIIFGLLAFVKVPAISQEKMEVNNEKTIANVASSNSQLSTLVKALRAADLIETLQNDGPFTVFAPTNQAFNSLPEEKLNSLLNSDNKDELKKLLTYHVIPKRITFGDVMGIDGVRSTEGVMIGTLQGQNINLRVQEDEIFLNNSSTVIKSIQVGNGVIHIIDGILEMDSITNRGASKILHRTIKKGVPMYNRGYHEKTAKLYYKRSKMIIDSSNEAVSDEALSALRHATGLADLIKDDSSRAWALRYGMNAALQHMTDTMSRQMSL